MENIGKSNKTYRIRTDIDVMKNSKIDVQLTQHFDILDILSLKIKPTNMYQLQQSNYGVVVGRVVANGGFGVPNAKVSIFIPVKEGVGMDEFLQYSYTSSNDVHNGIRYNVLPDEVEARCHQDVGTLPSKTYMIDNNVIMQVFKDYYTLTTSTNSAGDYMLFGVPTGDQELHMDVDLSDIGLLSQTPRDMIYKGYNLNLFDSPTKFKSSSDLETLPQLQSQTKSIYVYPYWGETNEMKDNIAITRCDIKLAYEFEPTCVFIGSVVGDRASNAIGKKCIASDDCGKMSELVASEGSIEMIRFNINGNIEEYPIMGNRLIDGDGTWCYQIPMNLDYVTTDEFGNTVPTDDPTKGIPTRAKVRFRISMDDTGEEGVGRKKARYLIPHNPSTSKDVDYNFGSDTREESFIDLLWNKVYSVKNYIPRLEKSRKQGRRRIAKTREHTGIKGVNHNDGKNPIPYNNITMKLNFGYRFRCVMLKVMISMLIAINTLSWFINTTLVTTIVMPIIGVLTVIKGIVKGLTFGKGGNRIQNAIDKIKYNAQIPYVSLDAEFCMLDDDKPIIYVPVAVDAKNIVNRVKEQDNYKEAIKEYDNVKVQIVRASNYNDSELAVCVETQLAEENEVIFFNFYNDWLNGNLYFPLWFRKLKRPRKLFFGLIKTRGVDRWCSDDKSYKITQRETCDENSSRTIGKPSKKLNKINEFKRYSTRFTTNVPYKGNNNNGLIHVEKTMLDELVYYYNANWFKTDVILLGSLDEYDRNGIPQFFKYLPITTYQKPNSVRVTDPDDDNVIEMSGENWALSRKAPDYYSSGLFYQLACSDSRTLMLDKTCFNVKRVCEIGVDLDQRYQLENGDIVESDGLITDKEIVNNDIRAMFATMNDYSDNLPRLAVERNSETSMMEYQFQYSYGKEFDGVNWGERMSSNRSYTDFRGGGSELDITQRKNSFYFYFGLNEGKTAIEKFNSQFYADCGVSVMSQNCIVDVEVAEWCEADKTKNKINFKLAKSVSYPIQILVKDANTGLTVCDRRVEENALTIGIRDNFYKYVIQNGDDGEDIGYGNYIISVNDMENETIYDRIIELYPPYIAVNYNVMPFNVSSERLASIINESINDATRINYSDGQVVYGDMADLSVYPQYDRFDGQVSRRVNVNGRMAELGGTVALRLGDGYSANNCIVKVNGSFNIGGAGYEYDKTYSGSSISNIVKTYEMVVNDETVMYDVVCICLPYPGRYSLSVEHLCPNEVDNGGNRNMWETNVTVGEYTEPIISFEDNGGNSMAMGDVRDFISMIGGPSIAWGEIIDKGGVLDIMVNANNVHYQKLFNIYAQGSGTNYNILDNLVGGFNKKLADEEIEANQIIEEENIRLIKDLLVKFYQLFTRTQDSDGLIIVSNNDVTEITVSNVAYRVIKYEDSYAQVNNVSGQSLTNNEFNVRYGDFSTNEAVLFDDNFGNEVVTYESDSRQFKYTCTVDDPLGKGISSLDFYLFDKRMEVQVVAVSNFYKYKSDDEYNVDKVYPGNLSVKVKNGFLGYKIMNLYDNWGYDVIDGSLYPVDENGMPINDSLSVEYTPYSDETAGMMSRHSFNVGDIEGVSVLNVMDGVGNTLQLSGIKMSGECTLGLGGMLLVSDDFVGKGNMKMDYGGFVPNIDFHNWTDASVNVIDNNKCRIVGEINSVRDADTNNSIGWDYKSSVETDSVSVSGYFRNWVNSPVIGKGMAVEYMGDDKDKVINRVTKRVLNVYFCDTYSFECTNNDIRVYLYAHGGKQDSELSQDADNLPYLYRMSSDVVSPLEIDFGMYFTWWVKWSVMTDGNWGGFFDITGETKGFYISEDEKIPTRMYLNKYDEGQSMETEGNGGAGTMYWLNYQAPQPSRLHWLQNLFDIGREYQNGFNLWGSGLNLMYSNESLGKEYGPIGTAADGCIYTKGDGTRFNSGAFLWTGRGSGSEVYGYPITYCYDQWAHYNFNEGNINWNGPKNITGILLTSGPIVSRHVVGGSEKVAGHSYNIISGGNGLY